MGISDGASIIFFGGGGGQRRDKKILGGKNVKKKMPTKHTKICHFYAEIVKFGLIFIHLKLFLGQENIFFLGGGTNAPMPPVAPP